MGEIRLIIGSNIKRIAKLKGIRQVDIANYMGVSEGSVSNWIKGTNSIDIENLAKLCQYLGVSLDTIFGLAPVDNFAITDEEIRLLAAYRAADPVYQGVALEMLETHPVECEASNTA
ncbi:MAG: helix-turn-helix transcriptional regulator [Lachnospiraceae bacterium]|nr:helix-turn-helix transcriptional regulator [Lachnospiraceae bacterium]